MRRNASAPLSLTGSVTAVRQYGLPTRTLRCQLQRVGGRTGIAHNLSRSRRRNPVRPQPTGRRVKDVQNDAAPRRREQAGNTGTGAKVAKALLGTSANRKGEAIAICVHPDTTVASKQ